MKTLEQLLRQQFPQAVFNDGEDLKVGSFPEWSSLAHFNFLLMVEENFGAHFSMEEMSEMKSLTEIRARLATVGIAA